MLDSKRISQKADGTELFYQNGGRLFGRGTEGAGAYPVTRRPTSGVFLTHQGAARTHPRRS